MRSSRGRRLWLLASVLLGALPVAFGIIRAVSTGDDLRYLWLAGAAILGSMAVMWSPRGGTGPARVSFSRAFLSVAAGSACAAAAAIMMGTTPGLGLAIVATSFGFCTGTGVALATLARRPLM